MASGHVFWANAVLGKCLWAFDANIDAKGDRTDHSNHHTEVSLVSVHNKLIFGTLGIVAVILGIALAVWIFHRKRITKHRRRHADLLVLTYSLGEQTLRDAEGGKLIFNNISAITVRAPNWDVRQHHIHCDTIAYSANGRAQPSTREARGTGGGRSSSRGTLTTPLHTAPKFVPEKGCEAGRNRFGGEES
jgi:hypothetical protein